MMTIPPRSQSILRIGTRGSQLARWQAEWVAEQLRRDGQEVELVEIATHGDIEPARWIEEIGTRGVFTKAIQRALLAGDVDLGVHSLKDLPTEPVEGLMLAAVPPRESPADVLVSNTAASLESLPNAARVGTGSLRRQAQLRHLRPDLQIRAIRGNVDTRLRKLDEGQLDAIVLAEAGLRRLGLTDRIAQVLPFDVMLPAVGQGALAIECRRDGATTQAKISMLDDPATHGAVLAERALLARLRGGCMAPVGALGRLDGDELQLTAVVLSADGARRLAACDVAHGIAAVDAEQLGIRVADALLAQGAAELISESRANS
ncbi:MAG TPA: hydroxymethylbilane synthase [Lacipirellulaceae bacterium]|nr:hydroxymethylbilane synthase [Lacipirellulaceae bacterium]